MENGSVSPDPAVQTPAVEEDNLRREFFRLIGYHLIETARTVRDVGAFTLITLGVAVTKFNVASRVIHPLIRHHIYRSGLRLMPMISFLAFTLGFVIIGQTVSLLSRVGAGQFTGTIMVTVVVRELGPLVAALVVLARIGTATVVELGTARATGEVEALEALGIDPIHYLVLPRVVGLALSIFSLTVYLVLGALFSGYLFAFLNDVPLQPSDYFRQIALALTWQDFILLALKTGCFGIIIGIVSSYQGLARALRLEEVSSITSRAVVNSVVACVLLDALFIVVYLVM